MINIDNDDYIDRADHSLPAFFTQIHHMFLARPPPFYMLHPRLRVTNIVPCSHIILL